MSTTSTFTNENLSKITINCGSVSRMDEWILHIEFKDDYLVDLDDINEVNEAIEKLANGKKHNILTTGGKYTNFSQEVIHDSKNPKNFTYTLADAYVIQSVHQRLLASFYISIIKPPVPTKYFENLDDALTWFRSL